MNTAFYNLAGIFRFIPLVFLQKITGQNTIFPFYHLVSDQDVVHVKHLYRVKTTKEFENELDFILKHYNPINLETLKQNIQTGKPFNNKEFLLSFDDGLSQIYDIIAPILLRKGIPAVTFLNSAFIDNKDLFFRYKQSILIEKYLSERTSANQRTQVNNWFKEQGKTVEIISNEIQSIGYLQRNLLDDLATILEVDFKTYLQEEKPYLTSEQINTLINQGFDFGAHSIDHPHYYELPLAEQLHQTKESIQSVNQQFNINRKTFSFPFTDSQVSAKFFDTIFQKGNPIAELTFGCAGLKKEKITKHIQRIPLEIGNFTAQDIIRGEYLYYVFKMLLNKNTIFRS